MYSLYFQLALHTLKGTAINPPLLAQLLQLKPENMPLAHQLKIAIMHKWQKNTEKTTEIIQRVVNTCPIYAQSPDLALTPI